MRILDADRRRRRLVRKDKDLRRRERQLERGLDNLIYGRASSVCPRCGESTGPHYVPPSFGDGGFYLCDDVQRVTNYVRKYGSGRVPFDFGQKVLLDMESRYEHQR